MISPTELRGLVAEVLPTATELRRAIHRHPELSYQEFATTERVATTLQYAGVRTSVREAGTGLTAEIGSGPRLVAYRADLDALPIDEPADNPFASQVPGVMHACGHDAHTAIAVGIALALSHFRLPGRIRFVFQPAEESFPGGAVDMVREGAIDEVMSIIALHVDPGLDVGTLGLRTGAITGSADRFTIRLSGPGGHTARPHRTVDLIYAAGKVITELPGLLDRLVDTRRALTVVFGRVSGGVAENVIPATVELGATLRTLDRELWDELPPLIEELAVGIAAPTGAKVEIDYLRGIPPVINDPAVIDQARAAIADLSGPAAIVPTATSMGAEDFSRYLERIPGALIRLGSSPRSASVDLHSAQFVFDERALEHGIGAGAATLIRMLGHPSGLSGPTPPPRD